MLSLYDIVSTSPNIDHSAVITFTAVLDPVSAAVVSEEAFEELFGMPDDELLSIAESFRTNIPNLTRLDFILLLLNTDDSIQLYKSQNGIIPRIFGFVPIKDLITIYNTTNVVAVRERVADKIFHVARSLSIARLSQVIDAIDFPAEILMHVVERKTPDTVERLASLVSYRKRLSFYELLVRHLRGISPNSLLRLFARMHYPLPLLAAAIAVLSEKDVNMLLDHWLKSHTFSSLLYMPISLAAFDWFDGLQKAGYNLSPTKLVITSYNNRMDVTPVIAEIIAARPGILDWNEILSESEDLYSDLDTILNNQV